MQIFTFRTVCGHYLRVRAKFRRDRLNGCGVIASYPISNMAAVRHVGFFLRMRGTTSKVALLVFITVRNLDKIG